MREPLGMRDMTADMRYMGFNWDSVRNTDPYYMTAEEEQRVIDRENEMDMEARFREMAQEEVKAELAVLKAKNAELTAQLERTARIIEANEDKIYIGEVLDLANQARSILAKHGR